MSVQNPEATAKFWRHVRHGPSATDSPLASGLTSDGILPALLKYKADE
jgi:hypothetical protein